MAEKSTIRTFKFSVIELSLLRGKIKRSNRGVWDRPENALIMAISIQEPQRDCIPYKWQENANRSRKKSFKTSERVSRCKHGMRHFKKDQMHLLLERQEKCAIIKAHQEEFAVEKMSDCFKVSLNAFYNWKSGKSTKRIQREKVLSEKIKTIWKDISYTYGSLRVWEELQKQKVKFLGL